jgi:predicted GH43/DUF377 family glycosyl hydrolase
MPACASGLASMKFADTSRGRPFSKDPSVVWFGGQHLMYFTMPPKTGDTRWGQAVAASPDGHTWRTVAEIGRQGEAEARGICAGGAIVLGGRVHLFYQTYGWGRGDAICHAVSDDGVTFTRNPANPIISPTGAWTCGRAIDAGPVVIGDQLFCYWATRDPSYQVQMVGAHSTALAGLADDFVNARWYQRGGGPLLKPKLVWEKQCVEAPTIVKRGNTYVMFYAGGYNNQPQQIGYATSTNGLNWTQASSQPFLRNGTPGTWNACESGHPGIFRDPQDRSTWLYYQGNNDYGRTWYLSRRRVWWPDGGHTPLLGATQ